jgi:hypothetical protein
MCSLRFKNNLKFASSLISGLWIRTGFTADPDTAF